MFNEYVKSDASLPTLSTDGVIITMAIDSHERRNVSIVDIPGTFLNTESDEFVLILLQGKLEELMVQLDPKLYKKGDNQLKRRANAIREAEQGSVQTAKVCSPVLQEIGDRIGGDGI